MIRIETKPHGLTIFVEDWEAFDWLSETITDNDDCVLSELLDRAGYMGNGWNVRGADEFGFLSEVPCLTWMEETDEDGNNVKCDDIYYWSRYMTHSIWEVLTQTGEVFLRKL